MPSSEDGAEEHSREPFSLNRLYIGLKKLRDKKSPIVLI